MRVLKGRVAVVTGAASGLGQALAAGLGAEGCRVVLADIEEEALRRASAELTERGVECASVVTDVSDAGSVENLAAAAVQRFGAVHILCNNAGVSARRPMIGSTLDDYRWVIGVVLWGCIHGLQSFLPVLLEQDEAHIVNTSSMAGLLAFPMGGPYNAAKAGVVSLSETLHQELRMLDSSVGVSVVCPGGIKTRFLSSSRNRPDSLRSSADPASLPSVFAEVNDHARHLIEESGMAPEEVAAVTIEAVKNGTFYVLPHRELYEGALRARLDHLLHGTPPPTPRVSAD